MLLVNCTLPSPPRSSSLATQSLPSYFRVTPEFLNFTMAYGSLFTRSPRPRPARGSSPTSTPQSILSSPSILSTSSFKSIPENIRTHGGWVIFSQNQEHEFMTWWRKTPWYTKNEAQDNHQKSQIAWGTKKRCGAVWVFFRECAGKSGVPRVLCSRCDSNLNHPMYKTVESSSHNGMSTMKRHLKSNACAIAARKRGLPEIDWAGLEVEQRQVSLFHYCTTTTTITSSFYYHDHTSCYAL
jgi:hypothetical protein